MFFSRLCQTIFLGALALTGLVSSVNANGFCLSVSNEVPSTLGQIRMDTFYNNNTQWNGQEKASYDPVPYNTVVSICDTVGFALGSSYYVEAQLYTTSSNGSRVILNDTHTLVYFGVPLPTVTANWVQPPIGSPYVQLTCTDGDC
jgi:hypothetical protein